jgi:hypothetical protein
MEPGLKRLLDGRFAAFLPPLPLLERREKWRTLLLFLCLFQRVQPGAQAGFVARRRVLVQNALLDGLI